MNLSNLLDKLKITCYNAIMLARSYKYRLYPSKSQVKKLDNTLAICASIYNNLLNVKKEMWENNKKSISKYGLDKLIPSMHSQIPDLKSVHSQVLQNVSERVDLAYQSFFRRVKSKEKSGYPRYKCKERYKSFTFPQSGYKLIDSKLRISKIGDVKIKLHRDLPSKPKRLHIKKSKDGKYWAVFVVEVEDKAIPISKDKVYGFDLGLSEVLTRSDGKKYERQRFIYKDAKDIARLQRKCKKDGYSLKSKKSLAKAFSRSNNKRNDYLHKLSNELVSENQVMFFEDINIKNLMDGNFKSINRSLSDVSWAKLLSNILYKAEEAGRSVMLVNPRNTSRECSDCGVIKKKKLSERQHNCSCGLSLDRDHNAAINILRRGLSSFETAKAV